MKKQLLDYQAELLKDLQGEEESLAYLNAALIDEDPSIFLIALKNVLEAQGCSITDLAHDTSLNRENLYRFFSPKGNPKWANLRTVLDALELRLTVESFKRS